MAHAINESDSQRLITGLYPVSIQRKTIYIVWMIKAEKRIHVEVFATRTLLTRIDVTYPIVLKK